MELECGESLFARRVVLAMGPWSGAAAGWLGVPVPVTPLKGQVVRLAASASSALAPAPALSHRLLLLDHTLTGDWVEGGLRWRDRVLVPQANGVSAATVCHAAGR